MKTDWKVSGSGRGSLSKALGFVVAALFLHSITFGADIKESASKDK